MRPLRAIALLLAALLLPLAASAQGWEKDPSGGYGPRSLYKAPVSLAGNSIAQATTNYLYAGAPGPFGGTSQATPITFPGTFRNLYFQSVTGPAGGQTFIVGLVVGNTPGAAASATPVLKCTVSNPATTCSDLDPSHAVKVFAGQYYAIQVVTSATSGPTGNIGIGIEFDSRGP